MQIIDDGRKILRRHNSRFDLDNESTFCSTMSDTIAQGSSVKTWETSLQVDAVVTCISQCTFVTRDSCHIHVGHWQTCYIARVILLLITVKSNISGRRLYGAGGGVSCVVRSIDWNITFNLHGCSTALFWHLNNAASQPVQSASRLISCDHWRYTGHVVLNEQCSIYRRRHFTIRPRAAGAAKWPINVLPPAEIGGLWTSADPQQLSAYLRTPPVSWCRLFSSSFDAVTHHGAVLCHISLK